MESFLDMFSPLAFPNGALLYHFSTALPPPSNLALTPYELFREPMMVIGIADAEEYHGLPQDVAKEELDRAAAALTIGNPKLLVHQLLVMDSSNDHDMRLIPEGAMCVPAQNAFRSTALKTVMCDVSAKFLAELTTYAKAVQALPSIQSPGASSMPHRPPVNRSSSMGSWSDSPASSFRTPPRETSSRTNSPAPIPNLDGNNPPTSFDQIAATAVTENPLTRTVSRTERDGTRTSSKDRMSMQAFSSANAADKLRTKGKARVGIVIGNLYMMAGRWSDAWRELVDNTNKSRIASDHLWYARGLESIVVCMLLFVWTGYDFQIPAVCYSGSERVSAMITNGMKDGLPSLSTHDSKSADMAAQRLAELLPDLVMNILGIHDRASTLAAESLPAVAYSESVIRMAKMLALLQTANGKLESALIGKMIKERPSLTSPIRNAGYSSGISNHAISDILFRAYPSPTIPLSDAAKILSGIASVLGILKLQRKRAIVIKELLASLIPVLVQARKVGAAEVGIHPAASLSAAFDIPEGDKHLGLDYLLKDVHTVYGARHGDGINTNATTSLAKPTDIDTLLNSAIAEATTFAAVQTEGSLHLKIDILRACIDFCEALPDLPGIVHFAALLLRVAGPQCAISFESPGSHVRLAIDEQIRLVSNISRTTSAASKIGLHDIQIHYWDDFFVRSVQWGTDGDGDKLREHQNPQTVLESHSKRRTPFLYDPFAKQDIKAAEKVLVAEEPIELIVKLQNPYDFDLKVESLSLVSKGAELDAHSTSFILGPSRLQSFAVTVRPKSVGKLDIVGCLVKVFGCREQMFPIYQDAWAASEAFKVKQIGMADVDLISPSPSTKHQTAPTTVSLSSTVIQAQPHVIVEDIGLSESALMVLEGQKKTFEVKIRNASPTRSVDFLHLSFEDTLTASIRSALSSTDLSRAEMYELELKLSEDPVFTWVRLDSTKPEIIAPGSTATFEITVAGRPGLGAAKIMFDYAYLGQPLSKIQGSTYTRQVTVPVDITVNASIQLHRIDIAEFPSDFAWSNQHRERSEDKNLGISRPSSRRSSSRPVEKSSDRFRTLLDRVDRVGTKSATGDEEHCLVLLDLRNAWPNPLTVSIEVRQSFLHPASSLLTPASTPLNKREVKDSKSGYEWNWAYSVHEVIHPGHIARLVLLLPKLQIANPHAPIPLLSQNQRQYVVNTDREVSESAEMAIREEFWFREEVLKHVRGTWKEDGSPRQGTIDLRAIRFSPRMIDMLRLQDIDISMTLSDAAAEPTAQSPSTDSNDTTIKDPQRILRCGRSSFKVPAETFLTLSIRITNRSATPIRGILRLRPGLAHQLSSSTDHAAFDMSRKLVFGGLLQQAMPTLEAEESVVLRVGVCALVAGEYVVHALVEELVVAEAEAVESEGITGMGLEDFSAGGQGLKNRERRVWRATEGCKIIAS